MCEQLRAFKQQEYSRVLENHGGKTLSNKQCIKVLIQHGASYNQANNAAYTYLKHGNHLEIQMNGTQEQYNIILDNFKGQRKGNMECIRYLEGLGYSQGQAKTAVWKYRKSKGLIRLMQK